MFEDYVIPKKAVTKQHHDILFQTTFTLLK